MAHRRKAIDLLLPSLDPSRAALPNVGSQSVQRLRVHPKGDRRAQSTSVVVGGSSSVGSSSYGHSSPSTVAAAAQMDLGRHFYLNKVLEQYAAKPATRMTLRQLVFFGRTLGRDREKILKSANYVRQELAVRIAHRIRDLQALPFVVMTNAHLEEVYEKYWSAFETFRRIPMIRSMEDNEEFCKTLKRLLDDHLTIIPSLTIGIVESSPHLPPDQLDGFMERMLRSRISRRVLAEQHIALSEALDDPFHFFNESSSSAETNNNDGDHIGIIYTSLKLSNIISKVVKLLRNVFQGEIDAGVRTGDAAVIPEVVIDGALETKFAYIPEHLEYIFFELLKNSMMAVMRQPLSARDPVSIRVTIVEGPPDEDLIVRVSDCGGGLPDLLTRLHPQHHARRELRRKQHRLLSRKRREVLEDESHAIHTHEAHSRESQDSTRTPLSASSAEVQTADANITMDSNLSDSPTSSLFNSLIGDQHGQPVMDIAMSNTRLEVQEQIRQASSSTSAAVPGATTHRAGTHDPLVAAVTSFSNVRRRLEIEEEAVRRARLTDASRTSKDKQHSHGQQRENLHTQHVSAGAESPGGEKGALQAGLQALGLASDERGTGIDSRAKLEALRNVGRFKGTVAEQLAEHDVRRRSPLPSASDETAARLASATTLTGSGSADMRGSFTRQETGLGLPMTKIYTDFFGGSLSLRSLDGHGMDVYVRLPKLGTNKEAIEEIVL